jgi:hypothetical protein
MEFIFQVIIFKKVRYLKRSSTNDPFVIPEMRNEYQNPKFKEFTPHYTLKYYGLIVTSYLFLEAVASYLRIHILYSK